MSVQVEGLRRTIGAQAGAEWKPSTVPVIVIAGAIGGIGSSTVATLLALTASQEPRRTLLVDTDENVGSLHRILAVQGSGALRGLLNPDRTVESLVVQVGAHCDLLPGGEDSPRAKTLPFDPTARRTAMRRLAQAYEGYDLVVIDAGSRLDGILSAADCGLSRLVVVTGVTPVAIAAAYAVLKTAESRHPGLPVDVLFNRQAPEAARIAFDQVSHAASHFLGRSVGFAGVLPEDPALPSAPDLPLQRCARGTELALQELAAALLNHADAISTS
jgi:MinD-like ATPase involved in chromosome partitioning or flagellar assembly